VTIAELARAVASEIQPQARIEVAGVPRPGAPPQRYVPSTARARAELGLDQWIDLPEAIRRTAAWHSAAGAAP
jgi:dTDP-glucose 4,6-dehydratase